MRSLLTRAVLRPLSIASRTVLACLSGIRGLTRKPLLWFRPGREQETAAQTPHGARPDRPAFQVGTVRAVLRPRGLVEVADLVESAWWECDEPSPTRDALVYVERAADRSGWRAHPLRDPPGLPEQGQGTAAP